MDIEQKSISEPVTFHVDAAKVIGALRTSIANVISTVGGVRKPTDLQKSLKLDWTLSWQLFQIAGAKARGEKDAISRGANVPSRSSLKKFLEAAQTHGTPHAKVERVWADYESFERLVDVHAGDRTSFNSMISATGDIDEEWLAADAQHSRNAYRAMSHKTGMQARTKMICGIYNPTSDGKSWDFAVAVGYTGLRVLRTSPRIPVFRLRIVEPQARDQIQREPINLCDAANGFLLADYSSQPLPPFEMREVDAGWVVGELKDPDIGNLGASSMYFGTVYRNHPIPGQRWENRPFNADVFVDKPVEVLISDAIVKPGMMRGVKPTVEMFLGNNHSDAPVLPGDLIPLLGNYRVDFLGTGPEVLAISDVPQYPEMADAIGKKLGWDLSEYEVWRIRIEYPTYQATVRMKWELP
jgi:hypothetical protein